MSTKKDKFSIKDQLFMDLALDLARAREGHTGPNPSVGCVIVKNDKIISIGQTSFNGRPHAELNAIKNTNENLKGSTMYVTLEPCSHIGVTPPCTKAIINSKIKEVIYSVIDVDKRVSGKTYKILRANSVKVKIGLLKNRINEFYVPYFFNRKKKLPYISGKIAISKNNLIYSKNNKKITNSLSDKFTHFLRYKNDSILVSYKTLNKDNPRLNCRLRNLEKFSPKRITNVKTDKLTHFLRYKNDSILISYKTLNKDNPKLNCRIHGLKNFSPKRIILDNYLQTKKTSYIYKTANVKNTIIFYKNANKEKISIFKKKGIHLIKSDITNNNGFDIKLIFMKLYDLGCRNLLIEGGNELSKSILKKKLFNEFYLFKSTNRLSKAVEHKEFNCFRDLSYNYKVKINTKLGKDSITHYKN